MSGLEQEAEKLYPMPKKPCVWVRRKIEWLREQWINKQKLEKKWQTDL